MLGQEDHGAAARKKGEGTPPQPTASQSFEGIGEALMDSQASASMTVTREEAGTMHCSGHR